MRPGNQHNRYIPDGTTAEPKPLGLPDGPGAIMVAGEAIVP